MTPIASACVTPLRGRRGLAGLLTACCALALAAGARAEPFLDEVVAFSPGMRAGFGAAQLPGIILGPPRGAGEMQGGTDVVSLGDGGSIVVAFRDTIICDGPGPDFTIFENVFRAAGGPLFTEVGIVAVSLDGESFSEFPYDAESLDGLAGRTPVYSHPDNDLDPLDPLVSGGDSFDLADLGLSAVAYVRIVDPGAAIEDIGNRVPSADNAGFDLDAVAALHECTPGGPTFTPSPTPTATPSGLVTPDEGTATPTASDSPTRRPTPTRTPTSAPSLVPGDANGDGVANEADRVQTIGEIFDGDGDGAADAGGGLVPSSPGVDANQDEKVTASDLLIVAR